jgi:hypothetical protein
MTLKAPLKRGKWRALTGSTRLKLLALPLCRSASAKFGIASFAFPPLSDLVISLSPLSARFHNDAYLWATFRSFLRNLPAAGFKDSEPPELARHSVRPPNHARTMRRYARSEESISHIESCGEGGRSGREALGMLPYE